jgi:hypothetical protein
LTISCTGKADFIVSNQVKNSRENFAKEKGDTWGSTDKEKGVKLLQPNPFI